MAKLKATPKDFGTALAVLDGELSTRLGNNTYLELSSQARDYVAVRLHNTEIVRFHLDGRITLHTGGYHTATTKERINQFITGRVYASGGQWFVYVPRTSGPLLNMSPAIYKQESVEFTEGMNIA